MVVAGRDETAREESRSSPFQAHIECAVIL